jgi:hypothetical protein
MSNYEKIKASVIASSVADSDKKVMLEVFAKVDEASLCDIAELFQKDKSWVDKFNENRKMKHKAATEDSSLWKEILEKEKKYLSDLTYGLD